MLRAVILEAFVLPISGTVHVRLVVNARCAVYAARSHREHVVRGALLLGSWIRLHSGATLLGGDTVQRRGKENGRDTVSDGRWKKREPTKSNG